MTHHFYSYVILLLVQPQNFSPPANLSSANVGVSVFELTDYIKVCFTFSFSSPVHVFTRPLRIALLDPLLRCVVIYLSERRSGLFYLLFFLALLGYVLRR